MDVHTQHWLRPFFNIVGCTVLVDSRRTERRRKREKERGQTERQRKRGRRERERETRRLVD